MTGFAAGPLNESRAALDLVSEAMAQDDPASLHESEIDFNRTRSVFAIALHMHQPLIPAGPGDLQAAPVISNLKRMMDTVAIISKASSAGLRSSKTAWR
jgi:hypothetical protein